MNPFKQLLKAAGAHPPVGTWIGSAHPMVAEALACAGFDWAVLDMEHAPLDLAGLVPMLQAVSASRMVPVVRVPWNDAVVVKRVLDAGATTLLFPMIESAEEARRAVAATRYPPDGLRGLAGMTRASRYGTTPRYFETANHGMGVIVQVETTQALERIDEIAGTPGVDAVFIGPADLSASMGLVGQLMHPTVLDAMAQAARRCKALGVPIGTLGGTPDEVVQYRAAGFDYVAVGTDLGLMVRGAQAALAALRTQDTVRVHSLSGGTRTAAG